MKTLLRRILPIVLLFLAGNPRLMAAANCDELVFQIKAALIAHNAVALGKCFNFQGTDKRTQDTIFAVIEEVAKWPTHYVYSSVRAETGKLRLTKDGKNYTLNGDWQNQIHLFLKKPPSKGFVLPAGIANGQFQILLEVEEKK